MDYTSLSVGLAISYLSEISYYESKLSYFDRISVGKFGV